jgi:ABC-type branched-subunit amino acid transport system substrate-binding protein
LLLEYGFGIASAFGRAAGRLGIRITGSRTYSLSAAARYLSLAGRIKRAGADGVFVAGSLSNNGVTLLRDLRRHLRKGLGPNVRFIGSDGFPPFDLASTVGAAADGVLTSIAGLPTERLPRAGRRLMASFRSSVGEMPFTYAVYSAQAMDVLLDAIARSNGTRASVISQLFRTRVRNGILGDFAITASGDTTASSVTIYRIERGGGSPPGGHHAIRLPPSEGRAGGSSVRCRCLRASTRPK